MRLFKLILNSGYYIGCTKTRNLVKMTHNEPMKINPRIYSCSDFSLAMKIKSKQFILQYFGSHQNNYQAVDDKL